MGQALLGAATITVLPLQGVDHPVTTPGPRHLHQTLAEGRGGQAAGHRHRCAQGDTLIVPLHSGGRELVHQEPTIPFLVFGGAFAGVRVVLRSKAVQQFVGQVEHPHPERDPVGPPGPQGDEQTVEVEVLGPTARLGLPAPGLADASLPGLVPSPGQPQHLAREGSAGEEQCQAVAVKLVPGAV